MCVDQSTKFVGHHQFKLTILLFGHIEQKRSTVGIGSSSSIPIAIASPPKSLVLGGQTLHDGINHLFLTGAKCDANFATLVGEHLRSKHAGIGDSDQAMMSFTRALCDDEEPRSIRRAVNVCLLNRFVHLLLVFGQHDEIEFTGGCQ